jgi:hypothetical protein
MAAALPLALVRSCGGYVVSLKEEVTTARSSLLASLSKRQQGRSSKGKTIVKKGGGGGRLSFIFKADRGWSFLVSLLVAGRPKLRTPAAM